MKKIVFFLVILIPAFSGYCQSVKANSIIVETSSVHTEVMQVNNLANQPDNASGVEVEILNEAVKKFDAKDYKGAIEGFTKAIELHGIFYAEACYNRGVAKFKLEDYKAALSDYDACLKDNPNFVQAYLNRGIVKLKMGDKKGACPDFAKAVEMGYVKAKEYLNDYCQ